MDWSNENFSLEPWVKKATRLLPTQVINRFSRLIRREKDHQNFKALVSELKFGIVLQKISGELFNERKFRLLTPDWSVGLSQTFSIFEVYRLGKSNKTNQMDSLYDIISKKIDTLNYDSYLKIEVNDSCTEESVDDIEGLLPELDEWLATNYNVLNASKRFKKLFELTVIKTNTGKNNTLYLHGPRIIDQLPHKLVQSENLKDNEITKKLKKYVDIISEYDLPYFICVDIDFESGFHYSDFEEYFYGQSTEFISYDSSRNYIPDFGKEWTTLGEFYNPQTRTSLSGLLIIENGILRVLMNPNRNQRIYDKRFESLLKQIKSLDNMQLYDSEIPSEVIKMIEQINDDLRNQSKRL